MKTKSALRPTSKREAYRPVLGGSAVWYQATRALSLSRWRRLARAGLWSAERTPEPAELHLARAVREGIRAILIANSGGPGPAPGELRPLRDVAEGGQVVLGVGPGGQLSLSTSPAELPGPDLLALLLVIRDAQRDGTWPRLKACGNPDCRWAFYDRSHGQVGAWCDMATCGNRIKNRRLRQRPR